MNIIPIEKADLSGLKALLMDFHSETENQRESEAFAEYALEEALSSDNYFGFAARVGCEMAGLMICCYHHSQPDRYRIKDSCEVETLFTSKKSRKQGVGTSFYRHLYRNLMPGTKKIVVEMAKDNNAHLYLVEKLGFKEQPNDNQGYRIFYMPVYRVQRSKNQQSSSG